MSRSHNHSNNKDGHNHAHSHSQGGLSQGGHSQGGHCHTPKVTENNRKRVGLAAILTGLFMIAELCGGLISGSLALLADAGHMLTDFVALFMAWGAFSLSQRPPTPRYSFGLDRLPVLVAFINGLLLFIVAGFIVKESIQRVLAPETILTTPMLVIAVLGLVVNLVVFKILQGADQHNLNIRGAVLHVLGDLLGSVAAIAAALIIMATGWMPIDPILSVFVSVIILRSAWHLIKESSHILLEGSPRNIDESAVIADLKNNIPELKSVEDFHAWSLNQEISKLSLKAVIELNSDSVGIRKKLKSRLVKNFNIDNPIVEIAFETDAK